MKKIVLILILSLLFNSVIFAKGDQFIYDDNMSLKGEYKKFNLLDGEKIDNINLNEKFVLEIYPVGIDKIMTINIPILFDEDQVKLLDKYGEEVTPNTNINEIIDIHPDLKQIKNEYYPEFDIDNGFIKIMLDINGNEPIELENDKPIVKIYYKTKEKGEFTPCIATEEDEIYDPIAPLGVTLYKEGSYIGEIEEGSTPYILKANFETLSIKKSKSKPPKNVEILEDGTTVLVSGDLVEGSKIYIYDKYGNELGSGYANEEGIFVLTDIDTNNGIFATQEEIYKDESEKTEGVLANGEWILLSIYPEEVIVVENGTSKSSAIAKAPNKVKGVRGLKRSIDGIIVFEDEIELEISGVWENIEYNGSNSRLYNFRADVNYEKYNLTNPNNLKGIQPIYVEKPPTIIDSGGSGSGGDSGGTVIPPAPTIDTAKLIINCVDTNGVTIHTQTINNVEVGKKQTINAPDLKGYDLLITESLSKDITIAKGTNIVEFIYYDVLLGPPLTPELDEKPKLNKDDHYKYILGYPDGTVQPNGNITREEVATIFYRLLESESRINLRRNRTTFKDVEERRWSVTAIGTMEYGGIIEGKGENNFAPGSNITRAEFATIAARFEDLERDVAHSFTDIEGHWGEEYIASAYAYGWIDGYKDGTFKPDQPITRVEAMSIINSVTTRLVDEEGLIKSMVIPWPDLQKNHWGYYEVQEATISHDFKRRFEGKDNLVEDWTGPGIDPDFDRY